MEIRDICFRYGDKEVFRDFSLSINDDVTCIMAESGRGKTTLLKLIAGLIRPESGSIELGPAKPAMLFQEDRLLPWLSSAGNVELVCDDREKADSLLKALEIDGGLFPSELSGGMARRVSLARCMALDSDILLLDEPFTGLDRELVLKTSELLLDQGKRIIFSTHAETDAEIMKAAIIRL